MINSIAYISTIHYICHAIRKIAGRVVLTVNDRKATEAQRLGICSAFVISIGYLE